MAGNLRNHAPRPGRIIEIPCPRWTFNRRSAICARLSGPEGEAQLRNLLETAYRRGVSRIVHLSTTEVYGVVAGDLDEEAPVGPGRSEYARSKIAAERVCSEYIARGLPLVILRPSGSEGRNP